MSFKQEAAAQAITLVSENDIVGLGAGATMAYAVGFLKNRIKDGLKVKVATSSFSTRQLLLKENLEVLSTTELKSIDIYFDGCDQFDKELNALKSGGGIHTQEKLLASMAKQFVLVGDETKLTDVFDKKFPLVIEMLPQSLSYVPFTIEKLFDGVRTSLRMSDKKEGPVVTENGNYLLDIYFERWPDLPLLNPSLKNISGIVETSLFYGMACKAIIAGKNGLKILEKMKEK